MYKCTHIYNNIVHMYNYVDIKMDTCSRCIYRRINVCRNGANMCQKVIECM